jgi:hypothetical protein
MEDAYYRELNPIIHRVSGMFDALNSELCPACARSCCAPCVEQSGYYGTHDIDDLKARFGVDAQRGFLALLSHFRGC